MHTLTKVFCLLSFVTSMLFRGMEKYVRYKMINMISIAESSKQP